MTERVYCADALKYDRRGLCRQCVLLSAANNACGYQRDRRVEERICPFLEMDASSAERVTRKIRRR